MDNFMIVPMETETDINAKAYVHWKTWQETYHGLMPESYLEKMTLEKCVEMAHRWPQNTLLLKVEDKVVGFTSYTDNAEEYGEVIALYLLQEFHGKKLGYMLINAAIEKMKNKKHIVLWVLKRNDKAIKFYEKFGFRFDGNEKDISFGKELRMVWKKGK